VRRLPLPAIRKKMTNVENYSSIIDNIFGTGTTTFDIKEQHSNKVIGALNHSQFNNFKENFIERLKRLKKIYTPHPTFLKEILVQVNEIQSLKNWDGAFAELAAFDHLNSTDELYEPINPNVTLSSSKSLAGKLGKKETNLDGFIKEYSLYFDIKCLKDNNEEILNGIYLQFKKHLNYKNVHFSAEYALDISYDDLKKNRNNLLNELKQEINTQKKQTNFQSKIIPNFSIRILWDGGVLSAIRTYDPYLHAENLNKSIFNYANKFMKTKPTLIVLVVFPWYNLVVNDFGGSNIEFYRSFCRRFFCQYKHSNEKMSDFNSNFKGSEKLHTISKYLSGIIILEDNTILSEDKTTTNVKCYSFLNPNAKNPIRSMPENYINQFTNERFDDFRNDNY